MFKFSLDSVIKKTHVDDHVSDDLIISYKLGVLFLRLKEAIEEVLFAFAHLWILHTFHESLDREAGGDREIIEFVE